MADADDLWPRQLFPELAAHLREARPIALLHDAPEVPEKGVNDVHHARGGRPKALEGRECNGLESG